MLQGNILWNLTRRSESLYRTENARINQKIIEKESTVIEELFYFISKYLKIVIIKTVVIKTAIKMQE